MRAKLLLTKKKAKNDAREAKKIEIKTRKIKVNARVNAKITTTIATITIITTTTNK